MIGKLLNRMARHIDPDITSITGISRVISHTPGGEGGGALGQMVRDRAPAMNPANIYPVNRSGGTLKMGSLGPAGGSGGTVTELMPGVRRKRSVMDTNAQTVGRMDDAQGAVRSAMGNRQAPVYNPADYSGLRAQGPMQRPPSLMQENLPSGVSATGKQKSKASWGGPSDTLAAQLRARSNMAVAQAAPPSHVSVDTTSVGAGPGHGMPEGGILGRMRKKITDFNGPWTGPKAAGGVVASWLGIGPGIVATKGPDAMMGALSMVGGGAVVGGMTSSMTGGDFTQGAIVGAGLGTGMGLGHSMMGQAVGAANHAARNVGRVAGSSGPSVYSSSLARLGQDMHTSQGRAAMWGGGAMLGGAVFGGNKSHGAGFNSRRGNRIGR